MRRAAKRDANEAAIVATAEGLGAVWIPGLPFDGWLFWRGWHLCEVKRPEKRGHKDEYTASQIKLLAKLKERGIRVNILRTHEDVYRLLGAERTA